VSNSTFSPELVGRRTVHPFPARMAASIPWEILRSHKQQLRILDPMAGSGTSLIVARGTGHLACGFDLDPLAVLITTVGTANAELVKIQNAAQNSLSVAKRMDIPGRQAYPTSADEETKEFVRYWFDLEARKQLTALSRAIATIEDNATRKFLWCGLSRMIITKDSGVSLARDVSHSRPHKWFARAPVRPFDLFESAVDRVLKASLFQSSESAPTASVRRGDARKLPIEAESIDLVITSPPYLNAIDYMRGHKLSLVWLGHNIAALRQIRGESVGAEAGYSEMDDEKITAICKAMGHIDRLPTRFHRMITRYVRDMDAVIKEIARVLVRNGQALLVIGDCTVRGVYIRNSIAIRMLAEDHNLERLWQKRRKIPDRKRYLPLPPKNSDGALAKRLRTEVVMSFSKSG